MLKKILLTILLCLNLISFNIFASAPDFSSTISPDSIGAYNISTVDKDTSLYGNIVALFFPTNSGFGGAIWSKLQIIFSALLVVFLIWAGALFVLHANDEGELKKAKLNLLYILYGTFLFFGSLWLLGDILNIGKDGVSASSTVVAIQSSIIGKILIFFKSAAYYLAVILIVYYGYRMMQAQEKEDKIKAARTGALNVIIALIAIKVLDYIYYIAQTKNFSKEGTSFIASVGTVLGWILGVIIILVLLYSGFLLVSSRGNEEAMKKSKTIIRNVFLVVFILFLFIAIVFDLVKNFTSH